MRPIAIIGLGNPGKKYLDTRHNIGHLLIDVLAEKFRIKAKAGRGKFVYSKFQLRGRTFYIVKLTTFMNHSGLGVRDFLEFAELKPSDLLIAYDDFALDFGTIRIRKSGSDGGHNGMASIISTLGTDRIPRLRIGIGPVETIDTIDFVLGEFTSDQRKQLEDFIDRCKEAAISVFAEGLNPAMSKYNRKLESSKDDIEEKDKQKNQNKVRGPNGTE